MNLFSSVSSLLLFLLHIFEIANAEEFVDKVVQMECLADTPDLNSFRCIAAGSPRYSCIDVDKRCADWAKKGECKNNPNYMLVKCRKSCSSCIPLHSGDEPQIADRKSRSKVLERLYETQEYLHRQADRNIESLKRCVDHHPECTHWWSVGDCQRNPRFMHKECSAACQTCEMIV
jgi:hypothetical protein